MTTMTETPLRSNKFGSKCSNCQTWVPARAGILTGSKGNWKVTHAPGLCDESGESPAQCASNAIPGAVYSSAHNGYVQAPKPVKKTITVTMGVYKHNGQIYVVRPSKKHKGYLYAARLVESAPRVTLAGTIIPFRLVKSYSVIYDLIEAERMPLADANEISAKYGCCFLCHRKLFAAETILECQKTGQWVGPVCRKNFFPASV